MSIATAVRRSLDAFKSLESYGYSQDHQGQQVEDELTRFKVWCGNLSAHRPSGTRSLEYRLRDSPGLRDRVIKLLNDLTDALEEDGNEDDAGSSTEEDEVSFDFEYDEVAVEPRDPISKVHDLVNLLYRFSVSLRNPATQSYIAKGDIGAASSYLPWDLDRVRSRYPEADDALRERLARAMATRRQYVKYRESHHEKLAEGLDAGTADEVRSSREPLSTIATSVHSVRVSTDMLEETESVYSMTSFALTESETGALRPPPFPRQGQAGNPFECPICYTIQFFDSQKAWSRHVYEDLRPYCCTVLDCTSRNTLYSHRRDWQRHQIKTHNSVWVCPFGCSTSYDTPDALGSHFLAIHDRRLTDATLSRILDACRKPLEGNKQHSCPLCHKVLGTTNLWYKHVGRHMEQLALSSLPNHLLAHDSDEEDDGEEANVRSSRSEANDSTDTPSATSEPLFQHSRLASTESDDEEHETQRKRERAIHGFADRMELPGRDGTDSPQGRGVLLDQELKYGSEADDDVEHLRKESARMKDATTSQQARQTTRDEQQPRSSQYHHPTRLDDILEEHQYSATENDGSHGDTSSLSSNDLEPNFAIPHPEGDQMTRPQQQASPNPRMVAVPRPRTGASGHSRPVSIHGYRDGSEGYPYNYRLPPPPTGSSQTSQGPVSNPPGSSPYPSYPSHPGTVRPVSPSHSILPTGDVPTADSVEDAVGRENPSTRRSKIPGGPRQSDSGTRLAEGRSRKAREAEIVAESRAREAWEREKAGIRAVQAYQRRVDGDAYSAPATASKVMVHGGSPRPPSRASLPSGSEAPAARVRSDRDGGDGVKIQSGDSVLHVRGDAAIEVRGDGEDGPAYLIVNNGGRDKRYSTKHDTTSQDPNPPRSQRERRYAMSRPTSDARQEGSRGREYRRRDVRTVGDDRDDQQAPQAPTRARGEKGYVVKFRNPDSPPGEGQRDRGRRSPVGEEDIVGEYERAL